MNMTKSPLAKVPVLRILVPFIVGILLSRYIHSPLFPAILLGTGLSLHMGFTWAVPRNPQWSMKLRPLWIVPLGCLSVAAGAYSMMLCNVPSMENPHALDGANAQVVIEDIQYKDNSMSIYGNLTSATDDTGAQLLEQSHKILLTTRGCDYTLMPGDILAYECALDTIKNMGNPDGFDYKNYMLEHGIRYSQHLAASDIRKVGEQQSITSLCNKLRRNIIHHVFDTDISAEAQSFVVATLLGNSKLITPETRAEFSAAGISHILALSGLHVGIIMVMVWFLLYPLDYMGWRRLRLVITLVLMLCYAFFTGLSPSVVRATVMASVGVTGLLFYRKSVSINALGTAALILLAFNPYALFNPGFQLSFVTVASLLMFYNKPVNMPRKTKQSGKFRSWFMALASTSAIALISTLMLSAWYFNSFSLQSLISNLVIIPLFPVLMFLSVIFLMLSCCDIQMGIINHLVDGLYNVISSIAKFTGQSLPGHIDNIYVTGVDVMLYYAALGCLLLWIHNKRFMWANMAVLLVTLIFANGIYLQATTPSSGFVVFNNYSHTQVFSFADGKGTLWTPNGEADVEEFKTYNKAFLAHYNIDSISSIEGKECAVLGGRRIVCAGSESNKAKDSVSTKIDVDYLIITKKYHKDIEKLCKVYQPRKVILSGDIYKDNANKLLKECRETKLPHYSVKNDGAFVEIK